MSRWHVWDGHLRNGLEDDIWNVNNEATPCGVVHGVLGVCFIRQKDDGQFYLYEWKGGVNETGPYPTLDAAKLAAELMYG